MLNSFNVPRGQHENKSELLLLLNNHHKKAFLCSIVAQALLFLFLDIMLCTDNIIVCIQITAVVVAPYFNYVISMWHLRLRTNFLCKVMFCCRLLIRLKIPNSRIDAISKKNFRKIRIFVFPNTICY